MTVYRFVWDNSSTQKSDEHTGTTTDHTELTMRLSIDRVAPDGSADGTLTYDRIQASGEPLLGGRYAFDSDASQPDPQTEPHITAALRLLADSTVRFHANAKGHVDPADVTGTRDACAAMQQLDALHDRVAQFNNEGLSDLLESMWRIGEEAFVRDITKPWKEVGVRPFERETVWFYHHTFTPVEQTPQRVVIELHTNMRLSPESPEVEFTMHEGAFRYVWDRQRHEVVERTGVIDLEWDILQHTFPETTLNQRQRTTTALKRVDE